MFKRYIIKGLITLISFLSIITSYSFPLAASDNPYQPKWKVGNWWEVEVIQRAIYDREPGTRLLAPLHWRFRISLQVLVFCK